MQSVAQLLNRGRSGLAALRVALPAPSLPRDPQARLLGCSEAVHQLSGSASCSARPAGIL